MNAERRRSGGRMVRSDLASGEPKDDDSYFGDFFRLQLFVNLHDGDIDRWIKYLQSDAPESEAECDLEYALRLKKELRKDRGLIVRIKRMIKHTDVREILRDEGVRVGLIVLFREFGGEIDK